MADHLIKKSAGLDGQTRSGLDDGNIQSCSACHTSQIQKQDLEIMSPWGTDHSSDYLINPFYSEPLQSITTPDKSQIEDVGQLPELAEDVALFERVKGDYLNSLDGSAGSAISAFERLIESAAQRMRLGDHIKRLSDARGHLKEASHISGIAHAKYMSEVSRVSVMSCHASSKPYRINDLRQIPDSVAELMEKESALRVEVKKLTLAKDKALSEFDQLLREAVIESVPPEQREKVMMPPLVLERIASKMTSIGEFGKAADYYHAAGMNSNKVYKSAWYGLEATKLEVLAGRRSAAQAVSRIKKLRKSLPSLMTESMIYHSGGDPFARSTEVGAQPPVMDPGKPGDVQALMVYSWGALYDVMQMSLSDLEDSDDIEDVMSDLRNLEDERRLEVSSRSKYASEHEANIHLNNLSMVVNAWTQGGGLIEYTLRSEDEDDAQKLYDLLSADIDAVDGMVSDYVKRIPGDRFYEKLATLSWQLSFDGMRSMDRPLDGIRAIKNVDFVYPGSRSVAAHLAMLRRESRALGIEDHLFIDGRLNENIDLSEFPQGITAGDRTRSAYWSSNSWRDVGVPALAGGGCLTLAAASFETIIGPIIIGGACAAIAGLGNREYNRRVVGSEAYEQALTTGLTNVTDKDASRYRSRWYWSEGFGTLLGGMPFTGAVVGGTGRFVVGGIAGFGRNVATKYAAAAAGRGFFPAALRVTGSLARGSVSGMGKLGKTLLKLPKGDLIRLGIGSGYPLDYAFIDRDYNLVLWDGKVDTAIGHIGGMALASAAAYNTFKLTWRAEAASKIFTKSGAQILPFASQVAAQPWRAWIIRAGADSMMADYFLIDKHYDVVNFKQPMPEGSDGIVSPAKQREYDRQFAMDNWLGWGGLLAMGGNWAVQEWRSFPMYIESSSRILQARARIAVGTSLVAADLVEDGSLNKWYLGGIGGSLLMNEAGSVMLEVDAWGSMVATGFRLGTEWLMQWQQDIPIEAPDAKRLMWASGESAIMRFPAKMYVMGGHYLKSFPLGKRLQVFHKWMNSPKRSYLTRVAGKYLRPIERTGGQPNLMPGSKGWAPKVVKADAHKSIKLELGANGSKMKSPMKLKVLKQQRRLGRGLQERMTGRQPSEGRFSFDGREMTYSEVAADKALTSMLKANGLMLRGGNLWKVEPWYLGQVRLGGRSYTAREIEMMTSQERRSVIKQLAEEGVLYKKFKSMGVGQKKDAIDFLKSKGAYSDDLKGALVQRWIKDPTKPTILSSHGNYTNGRISTDAVKIVSVPTGAGEVWLKLSRGFRPLESARVGGTKLTIFKGPLSQPRLRAGVFVQAPLMMGTAFAANHFIFSKTMDGDPQYQKMQRVFNYGFSELITHPLVQWPLGYDTALAQAFGRTIGIFVNMAGNELFPTYLNTWPGAPTYYNRLDGVEDSVGTWMEDHLQPLGDRPRMDPLDTIANTLSSSQITPFGIWGKSDDTVALFEDRGMKVFRDAEDCQRVLLVGGDYKKHDSCRKLPLKTMDAMEESIEKWKIRREEMGIESSVQLAKRSEALAENFMTWMERERGGDLSEMERRTLIIMAAHVKHMNRDVSKKGDDLSIDAYSSWRDLERKYGEVLFDKIPILHSDRDWEDFINHVNRNRSKASHFYFDLHDPDVE